ncbi:hypothetical protein ACFIJ5_07705 [Haloimpatiens sp. FM7330]|uniref:hypothetical protein n=1 Tax=Haloimpatiens sp. FM7330 TaxID=3298610 RepID=UPI00362AA78E
MNELVQQISRDLSIFPCDDETYGEYGNRVIYCALVAWAKVQVLGTSYVEIDGKGKEYPYVSQRYIIERMNNIVGGLLESIPHLEAWVHISKDQSVKKKLSKYILEKLIFCYQISETCNIHCLTSSPEQIVYFKNNELILGGTDWNSNLNNAYSIGLGAWRNKRNQSNSNYRGIFNIPECSLNEYYRSLEKNALWQSNQLEDEYEYFSGQTGLWHNKAWKKFNKAHIPKGISLLRKSNQKYKYILLWYKNEGFFTAKLDEWYYKEKEINRIMYALEYHCGKPAQFKAKRNREMIELHCHSRLPNAENRILLMASWPKRRYNDIYLRKIPICIWEDIEDVLGGLGIQVVFE